MSGLLNWQHFRAFLWLRWRLGLNQLRRAGIANLVILILLAGIGLIVALGAFTAAVLVGLFLLGDVSPAVIMYVWDGLVVAFIFTWMMGLVIELQRAELLSLDKFLHLPVSLASAFVINYLGSLFNLTMRCSISPPHEESYAIAARTARTASSDGSRTAW